MSTQQETPRLGAVYQVLEPPAEPRADRAVRLQVRVSNTGTARWPNRGPGTINLSYHWFDLHGQVVDFEGVRAELPTPLAPGESAELTLLAEPPPRPGAYRLVLDLVEEGVNWFSLQGVATHTLELQVAAPPPDLRRAVIVNGNLMRHDAVGNHVLNQLRLLQARGYETMVLVEHIDQRQPVEVRALAARVTLEELRDGPRTAQTRRAVTHFQNADCYLFNYSTYYTLIESIRLVSHGVVIFDYHGVTPPHFWSGAGEDHLVEGQRNLDLVRYADYAVGHSRFTCEELIASGAIPPERVYQVGLLVDTTRFRPGPRPAELARRYGIGNEQAVLLYVGRMAANKRISDLVQALPQIRRALPGTVLLLVGDDRSGAFAANVLEARTLATELGVAEALIFSGQIPDAELPDHYRLADLFVTASQHEGFCIPVIEAMASGIPAVGAHATALPETIGDGGVTFLPADPGDLARQVIELLSERNLPAAPPAMLRRVGFVTPRYGLEIVGGAERLMRALAEALYSAGVEVEILTTCMGLIQEWKNDYPPGLSRVNGLNVRRFPIDAVDTGQFYRTGEKAMQALPVPYREQIAFLHQNINSRALYQYLRDNAARFDAVLFAPYLFGTSYWGAHEVLDKAVLLPCLHDEPFAYFAVYRELLEEVRGIIYNTAAEQRFANQRLGVVNPSAAVVGYGFDLQRPPGDAAGFRQRRQLPEQLLYHTGRLEGGKNVPLLIDYFVRYKAERPGSLTLLLGGKGDVVPPARPDIVALGFLEEHELPDAFAAATIFCQPSVNESLSIVLLEAWLQGTPALVHADCAVTSEHVERSGGGWCFRNYEEFRAALDTVLHNPAEREQRGQAGRSYVQREYGLDVVTARLQAALTAFSRPRSRYERLVQRGVRRALEFAPARFDDAYNRLLERAEAELMVGMSGTQAERLRGAAHVGMPGYQVTSNLPVVGRLIAWLRRNLTSHLREPYLDPILARQEQFNQQLLDTLLPALERSVRTQQRLERQIRLLEQELTRLQRNDSAADE